MTGADGHVYIGKYMFDLRYGRGMMIWPAGHRYEGDWEANERQGEGIMIYNNGQINEGIWKKDKIFEPRQLDWTKSIYDSIKSENRDLDLELGANFHVKSS